MCSPVSGGGKPFWALRPGGDKRGKQLQGNRCINTRWRQFQRFNSTNHRVAIGMMDHMVMLSRIVALRRFSLLWLLKLGIVPMAIDMSMYMLQIDALHFLLAQQIHRSRSPL